MKQFAYNIQPFMPLILLLLVVGSGVAAHRLFYGADACSLMRIGMGIALMLLGSLKILSLVPFVRLYRQYDLIAQRWETYGYVYPFIECALGVGYLMAWHVFAVSCITAVVMGINAYSVWRAIQAGVGISCGCLGGFFAIPLTYVTFFEDLVMAFMALAIIAC